MRFLVDNILWALLIMYIVTNLLYDIPFRRIFFSRSFTHITSVFSLSILLFL